MIEAATSPRPHLFLRISILIFALAPVAANGQIWDGGGINNNWGTGANWIGNIAPLNNGTADIAFIGGVRLTPVIEVPWSLRSITFNGAGPFVIGGTTLTLVNGSIVNQDNDAQTMNNSLINLQGTTSFRSDLGDLVINAPLQTNGFDLVVSGQQTTFINDSISIGWIYKRGPGTLELNGTAPAVNLTLEEGTVVLGTPTAMNMTGAASLDMWAGSTLITDGTAGASFLGYFTFIDTVTIRTVDAFTLDAFLWGNENGMLIKSGPAELGIDVSALSPSGSYMRVDEGTVSLGGVSGVSTFTKDIFVGDGVGGLDADVLRLDGNDHAFQLTINSSGLFDLNGFNDSVDQIELNGGHINTNGGWIEFNNMVVKASNQSALMEGEMNPSLGIVTVDPGPADPEFKFNMTSDVQNLLVKLGDGVMHMAGSGSFGGRLGVQAGTVILDKPGGSAATLLQVGLHGGASRSAVAQWAQSEQIKPYDIPGIRERLTVLFSGWARLGAFDETISHLEMLGGELETSGGSLTVQDSITVTPTTSIAIINGDIVLEGGILPLLVTDGPALTDLTMSGSLSENSSAGFRKLGSGRMLMYSSISLSDSVVIEGGSFFFLGSNTLEAGTFRTTTGTVSSLGGTVRVENFLIEGNLQYFNRVEVLGGNLQANSLIYGGGDSLSHPVLRLQDGASGDAGARVIAGDDPGTYGRVEVEGAGTSLSTIFEFTTGDEGNGSCLVSDRGEILTLGDVRLGRKVGSYGEITVSGHETAVPLLQSRLVADGDLLVGDLGTGIVHLENGAQANFGGHVIIAAQPGSQGDLDIGGTVSTYPAQLTVARNLYVGGSPAGAGGSGSFTMNPNSLVVVVDTLKTFPGGVFQINGGILDVGTLCVTEGTNDIAGGVVIVDEVVGNLNVTGGTVISPGASPGLTNVAGNYSQDGTSTLLIDIGGLTPGTGFDQLTATGSAVLDGILDLVLWDGFEPQLGDSFVVLGASSVSGTFCEVRGTEIGNGKRLRVEYLPDGVLVRTEASGPFADGATCDLADLLGGRGVVWGDFNGDGDMDLYIANKSGGTNKLLIGDGSGGFTDATSGPLGNPQEGHGVSAGDYDNDGDLDIYLTNFSNQANVLFRNEGGGNFVDVTIPPLGDTGNGLGTAWVDVNQDGLLDIYFANFGANKLFINQGGGSFIDNTPAPLNDASLSVDVSWGDYDDDGDQDLFLVNSDSANRLYRNDGGLNFVDVTPAPMADTGMGRSADWGDYDNDGDLDLYMVNRNSANHLYRNDGGGTFVDVTSGALGDAGPGVAGIWGDYDNDGDLDLYVTSNGAADQLLRNDSGVFVLVNDALVNTDGSSICAAWGDADADGDLDLVVTRNGNRNLFLLNQATGGNHWLKVRLVGTTSNRSAIGARVTIVAGGIQQIREVTASSGPYSHGPFTLHFGLGSETSVDTVIVCWPNGMKQGMPGVPADQLVSFSESSNTTGAEPSSEIPTTLRLLPNAPNPFTRDTVVRFDLPEASEVQLDIFDSAGRRVLRLLSEMRGAGVHSVRWDGRSDHGRLMSSGVYFYRFRAGHYIESRRMTLLR